MKKNNKDANIGIIFDFNGTLFFDRNKHEQAWCKLALEKFNISLTQRELEENIHGRNNEEIVLFLSKADKDSNFIKEISDIKESYYRNLCLEDKKNFKLAPGVVEFLDYLKEKEVPLAIATASEQENVAFFIKYFNLNNWFKTENIIFDDKTFKGKPEPDIYLKASKKLNLRPEECIVFEDAISGVISASKAKIGKIIYISLDDHENENADQTIKSFEHINYDEILTINL